MMGFLRTLKARKDSILAIAERYGAFNVRVFGSVARGDDRPESDVDLLVSFHPGSSLLDQVGLKQDLEALLGKSVDVGSENALHWYLKEKILSESIPL